MDAIKAASCDDITLIDVTTASSANLEEYDAVGFASGIYYSKFEKRVLAAKNARILGEYGCFGFNTFGLFRNVSVNGADSYMKGAIG